MRAEPERLRAVPAEEQPEQQARVISAEGELLGSLVEFTQALEDQISGLQRDIRGWASRYRELKRDKEAEAAESPVWPAAVRVFAYWKEKCKHPRSEFSLDRFEMIRPFLEKHGSLKQPPKVRLEEAEALCKLAVDGIAFDHYAEPARNGSTRRHTGWHLIFETADHFEKRCNSAPLDRIREVLGGDEQTRLDTE